MIAFVTLTISAAVLIFYDKPLGIFIACRLCGL